MRPGSLYDKIGAIIILLITLLTLWNLTKPTILPISQPYIPRNHAYDSAYVEIDAMSGKAYLFFIVFHPEKYPAWKEGTIHFRIYLVNFTANPFGEGISLTVKEISLKIGENTEHEPSYSYAIDNILDGVIFVSYDTPGIYNVTIEITVQILSTFVIGWLPDKVIFQPFTTQINVTNT